MSDHGRSGCIRNSLHKCRSRRVVTDTGEEALPRMTAVRNRVCLINA